LPRLNDKSYFFAPPKKYDSGVWLNEGLIVNDKVRRFPIGGFQRWQNALGKRAVPCIVSNRWLQFPERSDRFEDGDYPDGDYVFVNVMTTVSSGENHKKLCTLCIAKDDLLAAIAEVDKEQQPPSQPVSPDAC
jgi:hypothetical protein